MQYMCEEEASGIFTIKTHTQPLPKETEAQPKDIYNNHNLKTHTTLCIQHS